MIAHIYTFPKTYTTGVRIFLYTQIYTLTHQYAICPAYTQSHRDQQAHLYT